MNARPAFSASWDAGQPCWIPLDREVEVPVRDAHSPHTYQGLTCVEYLTQYAWHLLSVTNLQLRQARSGSGCSLVLALL